MRKTTAEADATLRDIIRQMVNFPNDVTITCTEEESGALVLWKVEVKPSEFGLLIGAKGKHADAIRTLFHALGRKARTNYFVNFIDPKTQLALGTGRDTSIRPSKG